MLVTGATGLVGGWLVRRLLAAGTSVVCIVRDWVPQAELVQSGMLDRVCVVRGDVCDQELLERVLGEYEVETVLHLAAQAIVGIANANPISTFETNIAGTWRLLEACRRSPRVKQVVLASSDKAYGASPELPYTEETPLRGQHPYDVSKSCADLIAQSYHTTYGLPVAITRCGNFYGGGDLNWNRIVPGTIRAILRGEAPSDSFGWPVCARLLLRRRWGGRVHAPGRTTGSSARTGRTRLQLLEREPGDGPGTRAPHPGQPCSRICSRWCSARPVTKSVSNI